MKFTKKILSIVLTLCLLVLPLSTVFASAVESAEARKYPTVNIPGFMSADIYAEKNNTQSDVVWPISADFILSYVKKLLPSLAKLAVTWDWDKLGEETTPLLQELLGTAILDTNGEPSDGSGVFFKYPSPESITSSSIVTFHYDWRLDPIQIAAEINDFIEYVCECSGSDKVCITCHSLGGVMTLTYVTLYGDSRIQSIMLNSTAIFGETYNGELMTGQIKLTGEALSEFFQYVLDGNEYEALLDGLLIMLDDMKLTDFIAKFGNLIVEKMGDVWIPAFIIPMFAYWPAIWAMVPDSYMDEAVDYVFNDVMAGNGVDYSVLVDKINSFNIVREKRIETLNKLNEDANLYVMARYGYCSVPITPSWDESSDGVIDTKYTSFGATAAKYGTAFADSYITETNKEYISPDHTIDASTCMFPEQTWFIKSIGHSFTPDCLDDLFLTLMHYDGQADVNTFEQYPRFMEYDHKTETLHPDTSAPLKDKNIFERLVYRIRALFEMFRELFISSVNSILKKKVF